MSILSDMNKPKSVKNQDIDVILDCGLYAHNRWLEIALEYLPKDLHGNNHNKLLITSTSSRDACRVARHYCENREIILISERILPGSNVVDQSDQKARYLIFVVLHEIAHAIKKHKSPLLDDLSPEESKKQEEEADELAMKWFNEHVGQISGLLPITKDEVHLTQEKQQQIMKKLKDGI